MTAHPQATHACVVLGIGLRAQAEASALQALWLQAQTAQAAQTAPVSGLPSAPTMPSTPEEAMVRPVMVQTTMVSMKVPVMEM